MATHPLLVVIGIVALVALVNVAVWVPLIRRGRAARAALEKELSDSGEKILRGPEKAMYTGATATYSNVKGNGTIWLTERRIAFRKVTGGAVDVPLDRVTGAREEKAWNGSVRGGLVHLVVSTKDGAEVGFYVDDRAAWKRALTER